MQPTEQPVPAAQGAPGGMGRRLVARLIDGLLVGVVTSALGAAMDFNVLWLTGTALVVYGYFVVLDATWGTTVGKRLLGMRVVGPDGGPIPFANAAAREAFTLVGAVPFAGPFLALAAWIAIGVTASQDPNKRGFHDRMGGGTTVLRAS